MVHIIKKSMLYTLYAVLIIVSAIVCFAVILYASGYRINTKTWTLQKTGLLVIISPDNDYKVYADGERVSFQKTVIPDILESTKSIVLLPGYHDIEITKQGKITYKEHVEIKPELITKIDKIVFLSEEINEETYLVAEMNGYAIAPNNEKVIYNDPDNVIHLFDIKKKEEETADIPYSQFRSITSYVWSDDSRKVAIILESQQGHNTYIWDTANDRDSYFLYDVFSYVPFFNNIIFSQNNDLLYGTSGSKLYQINTATKKMVEIEKNIAYSQRKDNFLYYLNSDTGSIAQLDINIHKSKNIATDTGLASSQFKIIPFSNNRSFYVLSNRSLYLLGENGDLTEIDKDVENIFPGSSQKNILYYTKGYELWYYENYEKTNQLITRFSDTLTQIHEYDKNYLVYVSGNKLGVIKNNGTNNTAIIDSISIGYLDINNKSLIIIRDNDGNKKLEAINIQ